MKNDRGDRSGRAMDGGECGGCGGPTTRRQALGQMSAVALAAMAGVALRPETAAAVPVVEASGAQTGTSEHSYPLPAGDGVVIDHDTQVIVVRFQQKAYAFNLACPHENTALRWKQGAGKFECPKHNSRYTPEGKFIDGRATRNMDRLHIARDGNTLTVDLSKIIKSDEQPAEWTAAAVAA